MDSDVNQLYDLERGRDEKQKGTGPWSKRPRDMGRGLKGGNLPFDNKYLNFLFGVLVMFSLMMIGYFIGKLEGASKTKHGDIVTSKSDDSLSRIGDGERPNRKRVSKT